MKGKISGMFVLHNGAIAIQLEQGFTEANTNNECPGNYDWLYRKL